MTRDTYKYHFKMGNKILHTGITNNLERREREHKQTFGNSGHIKKVGNATTRDEALKWETEQTRRGNPTRKSRYMNSHNSG